MALEGTETVVDQNAGGSTTTDTNAGNTTTSGTTETKTTSQSGTSTGQTEDYEKKFKGLLVDHQKERKARQQYEQELKTERAALES